MLLLSKIKSLDELTFADDFIFSKVMSKPEIARIFLEELYGKKIKRIDLVNMQSAKQGVPLSHGIRFDVEFIGDDVVYDIEMQRTGSKTERSQRSLLRRVRHYQAVLDQEYLGKGKSYKSLPEFKIIFICTFDPFGFGCAKYDQISILRGLNKELDTGLGVTYLNAAYSIGNTSETIMSLLDYIRVPQNILTNENQFVLLVDEAVEVLKEDPQVRRDYMSLEEIIAEHRDEERREVQKSILKNIVQNIMDSKGCSQEEAMREARRLCGLPRVADMEL